MKRRNRSNAETTAAQETKLLVTVEEAAAMLSLGRTLTWALVRKGELSSIRVGKSRRVIVSSLHEYIERQVAAAS
jgi:excisionase family DNA binding protein